MAKKLQEFDTENPNYQFLIDAVNAGKIKLDEDNDSALIFADELEVKFPMGMAAYLEANGYNVSVVPA